MKFIKNKVFGNLSFSLIEVLVFISILSVFFITAIAVVTASLRNMKINEHKILATRNAEELIEWLTAEKEADWTIFSQYSGTYCFNKALQVDWVTTAPDSGNCAQFDGIVGTDPLIFKRVLVITPSGDPATQVTAAVTVSWQEPSKTYSVELNKTFSVWE